MAAKDTMAVVVGAPSKRRLQPIPPSADWRLDLAEGCPAHCQYCYLPGSLTGPPITRVFADLPDVLASLDSYVGRGGVTSGTHLRGHEGTTFEASCYTDPRLRFSVNAASVARRFEGATSPVPARVAALGRVAAAGYPVGLTIAPIMPVEDWRTEYGDLLDSVAAVLPADADLTVECITHRFTPNSKATLTDWYPRTRLEMDEELRTTKRGKFGAVKHVYPRDVMAELRGWFADAVDARLPGARLLYWT